MPRRKSPPPDLPKKRRYNDDCCLNCQGSWGDHNGWCCPPFEGKTMNFSELSENKRYLTQSMKNSIQGISKPSSTKIVEGASVNVIDVSDWRAWTHNRPGECACGIPKSVCTYHNGD